MIRTYTNGLDTGTTYVFLEYNEKNEIITMERPYSAVTLGGGVLETYLTPEQIEEIKRSMKNDHLYFA